MQQLATSATFFQIRGVSPNISYLSINSAIIIIFINYYYYYYYYYFGRMIQTWSGRSDIIH